MDPLSILSGVTGLLGVGSNILSNIFGYKAQSEANQYARENNEWTKQQYQQQLDFSRSAFERQQALAEHQQAWAEQSQTASWEREDSNYQRTKADLEKAGYSPLAINGTNDAGSIASSSSQPSIPSQGIPELEGINPFQMQNIGLGQLADIIGQAEERQIKRESNKINEAHYLSEEKQKEKDRTLRREMFEETSSQNQQKIDNQAKQFQENLDFMEKKLGKEQAQKVNELNQKIKEFASLEKYRNDKQAFDEAYQIMSDLTENHGHMKTDFSSYDEYLNYKTWWFEQIAQKQEAINKACQKTESYSETKQGDGGVSVSAFGTGASAKAGGSYSWSEKRNPVEGAKAEFNAFCARYGFPWYKGK